MPMLRFTSLSFSASLLFSVSLDISAEPLDLQPIEVTAARENLIGLATSASEGIINQKRIENMPLSRPGEVLEQVPGLIVSQHSGDGKANQYYLRGFNLDHGTDFAVWLDGMPLNMLTHAHGQGYIDSNWLIPELVESMHYYKGSYNAEQGDFSAAGLTHLHYTKQLPHALASLTTGSYGFQRLLNASSVNLIDGHLSYAIEAQTYDSVWDNDQNLKKLNGLIKFNQGDEQQGWGITLMAYDAKWDATDQVPKRAIRNNTINRFGAIDNTDGGETSRYSLSAEWHQNLWQAIMYAIHYKLNLFSNFTYFLDDPVNGDQFEQADNRNVFGGNIQKAFDFKIANIDSDHTIGVDTRFDDIANVGLYHTAARQRLSTTREDEVKQTSVGLWWQGHWALTDQLRASTGLRYDRYFFDVDSNLAENSGKASDGIVSPKLGLAWLVRPEQEIYINWGRGFHSNDARGATTRIDPASLEATDRVDPLVKAVSQEIGWRGKPMPNWQSTLTVFQLDLDSELLFIGDAGSTEASRPSRRVGIEWTNYLTLGEHSYLDADFAMTRARFRDSDIAGNHIPGAVAKTASIGLSTQYPNGWSASARLRYFGPRPLIENNSIQSNSTFLTNVRVGYQVSPKLKLNLDVFNVFDRKVSDIDYFYASRLAGEAAEGVEDIHTHPAEPRMARLTATFYY